MNIFTTKNLYLFLSLFASTALHAGETYLKITNKYINLPISEKAPQTRMTLRAGDKMLTAFKIRLADGTPDYWMFYDVSDYRGKTLTIITEDDSRPLDVIRQADTIEGNDSLYHEKYRQQFHFSTKRGWINDPNGLVYYDGEYHLCYQLNPFDVEWGNLNWGHAVSRDLIHWEELPMALQIDNLGEIYSGSAIVDERNVSGLGKKGKPAMLAFYTEQCNDGQTQCLAYSLDKGRTWSKWDKNPVLETKMKNGSWHNRDPKVFWYDKGHYYVMVLHEKDGHSIYTSDNLLDWTYQSHTTGFWECPELFELPVDGNPNNTKWVMCGASGTYMIGSFDGKKFTPESGKHYYVSGYQYAAQTFNGIPDGRRIQIGWASIRKTGMPFTGFMQLPLELTLRTTKDGIRMLANPVKEVEQLFTPVLEAHSLTMEQANERLRSLPQMADGMRVKARIRQSHPIEAAIVLDGQKIFHYDQNFNRVNGTFYSPQDCTSMEITADLYIDRSSVEGFIDGGHFIYVIERKADGQPEGLSFWNNMEAITIEDLQVFRAKSIW